MANPGPPPRRERDSEATREALLRAASELFAERGFDGVRVEAIAERAGVNKAMISYHFGGKRALYEAVLVSAFAEIASRVVILSRSPDPPLQQLEDFVTLFVDTATRVRPSFPALMLRELMRTGSVLPAALPHILSILGIVTGILDRGMRDGSIREMDPLLGYFSLVGSMAFFFATEGARREAAARYGMEAALPDHDALAEHMRRLVRQGYAAHPSPSPSITPEGTT
ncbi:MAG TPA: helix-turn-helix domain-containing protein [Thermoanaerobaculia bacterium]|nr:helix-turn-helix domain-containing protein [Thermoanaerobaculia bacterium]